MKRLFVFVFAVALLGSCNKDIEGCTDPRAYNYDPSATIDDRSCHFQRPCSNNIGYTCIPDYFFEEALIDLGYDDIMDGEVLTANISSVDSLNVSFSSF